METFQRLVSRQWTDLSQKRNSKRLTTAKPLYDPSLIDQNYSYDDNHRRSLLPEHIKERKKNTEINSPLQHLDPNGTSLRPPAMSCSLSSNNIDINSKGWGCEFGELRNAEHADSEKRV